MSSLKSDRTGSTPGRNSPSSGPDRHDWFRALGLDERLASAPAASPPADSARRAVGDRRLERWLANPVFANHSPRFIERLAADGLDPGSFLALLAEGPANVASRLTHLPVALAGVAQSVEQAGEGVPETRALIEGLEVSRIASACLRLTVPLLEAPLAALRKGVHAHFRAGLGTPIEPESLCRLLVAELARHVYPAFLRTLALEVNVARLSGRLGAATNEGRFDEFVDGLCRPGPLRSFYREYPVLARQVAITLENWASASLELAERLASDWPLLRETFFSGAPPGEITAIEGGAGDSHRQGRSVLKLTLSTGRRLIYKPRSLTLDLHFESAVAWLNRKLAGESPDFPSLSAMRVLDRGRYGWCEFVAARECESEKDVERFFTRQGAFLALLHLLEAVDFHSENLIAEGEHPVLVDLEALFHPRIERLVADAVTDPAFGAWADSVMRTGLLPERDDSDDDTPGFDVSGLGGRPGQHLVRPEPLMERLGTDEMHVEHRKTTLDSNPNSPELGGRRVDVTRYLAQVCFGFETVYRLIAKHRDEFLAGPLAAFRQDEIRVITRPTRFYDRLLRVSFHPDFLRDALDRERVFDRLWRPRPGPLDRLIRSERADLLDRDIPFFRTRADSRDVVDSRGARFADLLPESGYDAAVRRVLSLCEQDLERQRWFIRGSFATIPLGKGEASWRPSDLRPTARRVSRTELLREAERVGDRLLALAVTDSDGAGWIGLNLFGEQEWRLEPVGIDLYNGSAGIALFLAYLGELTSKARFREAARLAVQTIGREADRLVAAKEPQPVGLFGDLGGSIYLLSHLGHLWRDETLLDRAETLAGGMSRHIDDTTIFDLLHGLAGGAASLISLHEVRPSGTALEMARACGDRLIANLEYSRDFPQVRWPSSNRSAAPLTGLSHGAAGLALVLARLSTATRDPRYGDAALALLAYERGVFSAERGNWPDLRTFVASDPAEATSRFSDGEGSYVPRWMTTWCHGAPGIGLSRLGILAHIDDPLLEAEIATAIETTSKSGFGFNHSLCHGDLGNLELLVAAGPRAGRGDLARLKAMVVESIERIGWSTGIPKGVESPGLMTGIAGIGYGLLRLAAPDRLPSVLLLESPRPTQNQPM